MGKKSNKSKMRKLNSIIFISLLSITMISSCGMPGPLYQTPDKQVDESTQSKNSQSSKTESAKINEKPQEN
jgi:predicted small lipoprotein YifL